MLVSGDRGAPLRPQDQAKPVRGSRESRLGSGSPLLDGASMYRARDPEKQLGALPEVPALKMQIEEATTGNVPDARMT